jgi:3-methyladenine DNA glycosylase AlkD
MESTLILRKLKAMANPKNVEGMARFGINPKNTYGISVADLRKMADEIGKSHELAQQLWKSGIHEARILASLIDEPLQVSESQMERWTADFDSWDVCDQCCMNLFDRTEFGWIKAVQWSSRKEEFVKRAGFSMMATLASHDKKADNNRFIRLLPLIKRESTDERNYVKKAVNWALRGIGKRNAYLNKAAIATAQEIQLLDSKSAKWIANDALRELTSQAVRSRMKHG